MSANKDILNAFISAISTPRDPNKDWTSMKKDMRAAARTFLESKKERKDLQNLFHAAVKFRGKTSKLLRKLNVLVKSLQYHIVVVHDPCAKSAPLFVVRTPKEAFVMSINNSTSNPQIPQNNLSLRSALNKEESPSSVVLPPSALWGQTLIELLLCEIEDFPMLYEQGHVNESYRWRCMRCVRRLCGDYSLPASYYNYDTVREENHAKCRGHFSDVYTGSLDNAAVCVKVLRFSRDMGENEYKHLRKIFCREALCWARLDHQNILPFLGVDDAMFEPTFCLISPWMNHGNLRNFLETDPTFDRLQAAIDTVEGLRYLHELDPPIVHADIRCANILVTNQRRCCLADFGLAALTGIATTSAREGGTEAWMAPEIFDGSGTKPLPTRDIYAVGCTILEMFTGKNPFDGIRGTLANRVTNRERPLRPVGSSVNQEITDEIWAVITSCWAHEPDKRPSARQVLQNLGVPPPPNYMILRRPDRNLTVEALLQKLRSDREYLLRLRETKGVDSSEELIKTIEEELQSIAKHIDIHDRAHSGGPKFDLSTALISNIRSPAPRLIDDVDPALPVDECYRKYESHRDYLSLLLGIDQQTPRKSFLDRINGDLDLVQSHLIKIHIQWEDEEKENERIRLEEVKKEEEEAEAAAKAEAEEKERKDSQRIDTAPPKPVKFPRRRPGPLDLTFASKPNIPTTLPSALATARIIDDLSRVPYPENIQGPILEFNINARDGKFRYDRDFLLQFMSICKEKPDMLPPLEAIGMGSVDRSSMNRTTSRGGAHRAARTPPISNPPNGPSSPSPKISTMGRFVRGPIIGGLPGSGLRPPPTMRTTSQPGSQLGSDIGAASEAPAQRRRLILQPRLKPTEQGPATAEATPVNSESDSSGEEEEANLGEMTEGDFNKKIDEDSKEFFAVRNLDEAEVYFSALPTGYHHRLVEKLVSTALEAKEADAQLVADFFARVVSKGLCSVDALEEGFRPLLEMLEDIAIDAPKAPRNMALMMRSAFDDARAALIRAKSEDPDKLLALPLS